MELKDYQTRVLADLAAYLDALDGMPNLAQAFKDYWDSKGVRVGNDGGQVGMEPYKNTVPGVPHICAKVPTAGGKTFIAVNALDTVFNALVKRAPKRPKMVVWLVPFAHHPRPDSEGVEQPRAPLPKAAGSVVPAPGGGVREARPADGRRLLL
jgi:type III restriction enzyme